LPETLRPASWNRDATWRRDAEILKPGGRLVSTLYAADIPWFAERRITARNIASVENPFASRRVRGFKMPVRWVKGVKTAFIQAAAL
jgi:hypothetical protein